MHRGLYWHCVCPHGPAKACYTKKSISAPGQGGSLLPAQLSASALAPAAPAACASCPPPSGDLRKHATHAEKLLRLLTSARAHVIDVLGLALVLQTLPEFAHLLGGPTHRSQGTSHQAANDSWRMQSSRGW